MNTVHIYLDLGTSREDEISGDMKLDEDGMEYEKGNLNPMYTYIRIYIQSYTAVLFDYTSSLPHD